MLKQIIFLVFISLHLQAKIIEINEINDIRSHITENTLIFFDIDDTLISAPLSLGCSQWRIWARQKLSTQSRDLELFDRLLFYIAKHIPYQAVESSTSSLIADLHHAGHTVLGLTARGRSYWYQTKIEEIDRFTHKQLCDVGIDFANTRIPKGLQSLDPAYFYKGIFFTNHILKGDFLTSLFTHVKYTPSLILFIDDHLEEVQSVEKAMQEIGVPCIAFWYKRKYVNQQNFDAMMTNIQLESLLFRNEVIDDDSARVTAQTKQNEDPQNYFREIIERIDCNQLSSEISIR